MKYYLCITPFFPEPDSFIGPYVLDQVKAIKNVSDYQVVVFKPTPFYNPKEDYTYDGVKVNLFKYFTVPSNAFPNSLCDELTYRMFRRKLRELGIKPEDIAVCHAHVAHIGSTAVRLKRDFPEVRVVVQHHGFDVMSTTDGRLARFSWHERLCIRHNISICNRADINVGVSRKTLDFVLKQPGAEIKHCYTLYNGVDTSIFHPAEQAQCHDVFTIGCVANFWQLKDQMTLIRAVERLVKSGHEQLKVVFIGTGYTRQECVDYISEHGLGRWFEFRDTMHHRMLPDFYRSLDLFVLPSYYEAFGCVYTEAYACGVPFIGVKGQGISEIIPESEKDLWLIDKGDDERLASLIIALMKGNLAAQKLSSPIDINTLVSNYIKFLDNK